ncbi:VWA domain-containing protein [Paracoccus aerodenitrificans]|uniref:VWA domain-containing protein n=1 Tax=Paracoccus aerodenitrificans TaxID=3017781 RepID=UPI0022F0DEE3|nr:VWA domain-containing protein [Paracoccus aerodenitrificans]WBU63789.1 VWA domain-containing protein [Paracoccus aerodenitrificans]
MIELAHPWMLILLPLPLLVWRFLRPYRQSVHALRFPFFARIVEAAGVTPREGALLVTRRRIQMIAGILVWLLLLLSLAGPERVGEPVEITNAARDLMLVVDISESMDEQDFETGDGEPLQRLAAVKNVVGDFISEREGDRVALIVFGAKPFLQAPFTEDLQAVRDLLNLTTVGMAGPHTNLGDAIGLGIRSFENSQVEQRLMILLSDGADTGSRMSPVNAAEIAAQNGIQIFTIGVGDPTGNQEENQVDIAALQDIAQRTGGQFFFADDTEGLAQVYARIDELAPRLVDTISYRPRDSLAHLPALAAALLILLSQFLLLYWSRPERAYG